MAKNCTDIKDARRRIKRIMDDASSAASKEEAVGILLRGYHNLAQDASAKLYPEIIDLIKKQAQKAGVLAIVGDPSSVFSDKVDINRVIADAEEKIRNLARYEETISRKGQVKRSFLKGLYGDNTLSSEYFLRSAKNGFGFVAHSSDTIPGIPGLIDTFLANRHRGSLVRQQDIAENVRMTKQALLDKVIEHLQSRGLLKLDLTQINTNLFDENGEYQDILRKDSPLYEAIDSTFNPQVIAVGNYLDQLYSNYKKGNEKAREELEAYNAWVLLNNFDTVLTLVLEDSVIITKPENFNKISNTNYKTNTEKATNMWSNGFGDDVEDVGDLVSNITKTLIESSKRYTWRGSAIDDSYIGFKDFNYIIGKIKGLALSLQNQDIPLDLDQVAYDDQQNPYYPFDNLSNTTKDIIRRIEQINAEFGETDFEGKATLGQVVAFMSENPMRHLHAIFDILCNTNLIDSGVLQFDDQEKNLIWSLYKEVFGTNGQNSRSLFDLHHNTPGDTIFPIITQIADSMFAEDIIQYYEDENGVLYAQLMRDFAVTQIRNELSQQIQQTNGYFDANGFDTSLFDPESAEYQLSVKRGIRKHKKFADIYKLKIEYTNDTPVKTPKGKVWMSNNEEVKVKLLKSITIPIIIEGKNIASIIAIPGKASINVDANLAKEIWKSSEFKQLIKDAIGIDFEQDVDLLAAYESTFPADNIDRINYTELLNDISSIVGIAIFNQQFNNELVPDILTKTDRNRVQSNLNALAYTQFSEFVHTPRIDPRTGIISVVPEFYKNQLLYKLGQAKAITNNVFISAQVKTGEGTALASFCLSRLRNSYPYQLVTQNRAKWSATNFMTFVRNRNGLFKGVASSREIKSKTQVKTSTDMSGVEMWSLNFYNDWVSAYCKKHRSNSPNGEGSACFIPTVNSDKGQFDKLLCNLNAKAHNGKRYIDLNDEELIQELKIEFGPFYKNVITNIIKEYQKVLNILGIQINYHTNNPVVIWKDQLQALSNHFVYQYIKQNIQDQKVIDYINSNPNIDFENDLTVSNYITDKFMIDSQESPEDLLARYGNQENIRKIAWKEEYQKYSGKILKDLHKVITEYNKTHTRNPIQLAEHIHYLKGPMGLQINNTLAALWGRFGATEQEIQEANIKDLYSEKELNNRIRQILKDSYLGSVETLTPEQIEIIRQVDGENNLIPKIQKDLYNRSQYSAEGYFKAKDLESVIKLLKNGCKIYLTGNKARNQEETEFLKNFEGGKWVTKSGMMAFTRVEDAITHQMIPTNKIQTINEARQLGLKIEIHPLVSRLNKMDYLTTQQYVCCVGGAHYVYKGKSGANVLEEEANRWLASNKRNVCYASTVHKFQNKVLNGAPTVYNYAIIDDIDAALYNIMGELKSHTPIDGGMFVNSFMPELENNSLGGEAAGTDKKHFATFYFEEYAAGGITKTAGFAATNERMRNSEDWRILQENMSRRKWIKEFGNTQGDILESLDITKDYDGNDINWHDKNIFYYREQPDGTIKFYRLTGLYKTNNPNEYEIYEVEVDEYGVDMEYEPSLRTTIVIDNNWTLFNEVFGGYKSLGKEIDHNGVENPNSKLTYSENSRKFMVEAMNRIGYRKIKENSYQAVNKVGDEFIAYNIDRTKEDNHEDDQDDVWQPLKYSDIHFTPNIGAIKSAQMNVNPSEAMSERMDLNIMPIKMAQLGIQLDKEHHADEAELSMPTQIITACANKGYTLNKTTELYNALSTLTEIAIEDCMKGIMDILPEGQHEGLLKAKIAEIIVDKLIYSRDDNEALHAVMSHLEEIRKAGNKITPEEVKGLPWSDTVVYNKIYSDLATHLTNQAIKLKISGSLAVICPTHHVERLYGNKRLSSLIELMPGGLGEELALLQYQQQIRESGNENELIFDRERDSKKSKEQLLNQVSKVNTQHIYHVEYINPLTGELMPTNTITINYPQQYYYLRDELTKFRRTTKSQLNGAFASTSSDGTINIIDAEEIDVQEFYQYIKGQVKNPDNTIPITSVQKQKVFEQLAVQGYTENALRELLGNDPKKIRMFLLFHELSHKENQDSKKYPRTREGKLKYLDSKAIEIEMRATKEAWHKMIEIAENGEEAEKYLQEIAEINSIYEAVCTKEYTSDGSVKIVPLGRELSAYNVRFKANQNIKSPFDENDKEIIDLAEAEDLQLESNNDTGIEISTLLNDDQTVNWEQFIQSQKQYFEELPEKYEGIDQFTLDSIQRVVKSAAYINNLPDSLKLPLLQATLLYKLGKPFGNEDYAFDSVSVINKLFRSFPNENLVKLAVRYHMVQADSSIETLSDILETVDKYGVDQKQFVDLLLALKTCDIINGRSGSTIDQYTGKTVKETVQSEISTIRKRFSDIISYKENIKNQREFCVYDLDSIRLLFEVINDVMPKKGPGIKDIQQFGKNKLSTYDGISNYINSEPLLAQNKTRINQIMRAHMGEEYTAIWKEYERLNNEYKTLQKAAQNDPNNTELSVKRNDAYWRAINFLKQTEFFEGDDNITPAKAFVESYKYAIKTFLRKQLQKDLFRLSLDYKGERKIMSNGKFYDISEDSIEPIAYELIMPKIYKTIFGLQEHDDLQAILADKDFFTKRAISKLKKSIADDNLYDYSLKRFSGEHLYILDANKGIPEGLFPHPNFHSFVEEDGTYSRVDIQGNQIYALSGPDDLVMLTSDGTEVIVTKNPKFFIESNIFNTAIFSNSRVKEEDLQNLVNSMQNTTSKSGQKFVKLFTNRFGKHKNYTELTRRNKAFNELSEDISTQQSSNNGELDKLLAELYQEGRKIHASFDKSLDIIAGRIPAQSQQSFMTQRVVAFGDADINAAYVSTFQLFIQGSDLDIDTVNLIGAGFDRQGHYVLWSPHANIKSKSLIKASEHLPFPTGKSTELTYDNNKDSFFVTYNSYFGKDKLFTFDHDPNTGDILVNEAGVPIITFNSESPEDIDKLAQFIKDVNKYGLNLKGNIGETKLYQYSKELDDEIYSQGLNYKNYAIFTELGIKPTQLHDILMQIQKIVDDHNLYIKRVGNRAKELMSKNLCYYQMYSIAADPSNQTENQDSIDNSTKVLKGDKGAVAVAMTDEDRYDITSNNEKLSSPDPVTKADSLQVGQIGKNGVSIGAKGVQGNSLIQYALDVLLNSDISEEIKKRILLPVAKDRNGRPITRKAWINGQQVEVPQRGYKIAGKWRSAIANIHDKTYEESGITKQTDVEILAMLSSLEDFSKIAINSGTQTAAMLSVAVDNAKDLCLGKINAGPQLFGMYVYGITMGIDIVTLAKIMNSPQGKALAKALSGNIFTGEQGASSVSQAIKFLEGDYLTNYLVAYDFKTEARGRYGTYNASFKMTADERSADSASKVVHMALEELYLANRKDKSKLPPRNFGDLVTELIKTKQLKQYLQKIQEPGTRFSNMVDIITQDAKKSKNENRIYPKGSEWLASVYQLIEWLENYSDLAEQWRSNAQNRNDLKVLSGGAEEMRILGTLLGSNKGVKSKVEEGQNFINTLEEAIIKRKEALNQKTSPNDRIDYVLFCTNPEYREQCIQRYEEVKHSVNILQIAAITPHIFSYLRASMIPHAAFLESSSRYRSVQAMLKDGAHNLIGVVASQDKASANRGLNNEVNAMMMLQWLSDTQKQFVLPAGCIYFEENTGEAKIAKDNIPIALWTQEGLATFKLYMETRIIPGILKKDPILRENKFVKGLTPFSFNRTGTHATVSAYTLTGDMMAKPGTALDAQVKEYQAAFRAIGNMKFPMRRFAKGGTTIGNMQDAFYLYTEYVYGGRKSPNSLMTLFDDGTSELQREFREAKAAMDESRDFILTQEQQIRSMAPNSGIYNPKFKYYYGTDPEQIGVNFYRNEEKLLSSQEKQDRLEQGLGVSKAAPFNLKTESGKGELQAQYFLYPQLTTTKKVVQIAGLDITYNDKKFLSWTPTQEFLKYYKDDQEGQIDFERDSKAINQAIDTINKNMGVMTTGVYNDSKITIEIKNGDILRAAIELSLKKSRGEC